MSMSERLKWTFAVLFVLCGLPLLFMDQDHPDPAAANLWGGTAALFLGGFVVCLAWSAWETGVIRLQHINYSRAAQPRRFMAAFCVLVLAGCVTITAGFWLLFVKPH